MQEFIDRTITSELFKTRYADVFTGDANWKRVTVEPGLTFKWDMGSTYVQNPPYFEGMTKEPKPVTDIVNARILGLFLDSITTDHISPAGNIRAQSRRPANTCRSTRSRWPTSTSTAPGAATTKS